MTLLYTRYKRGTITKDGKLYGRYPDGSLYRIYSTSDRPFLQIVDVEYWRGFYKMFKENMERKKDGDK